MVAYQRSLLREEVLLSTKMCHKILNIFVCIFIFQKLVVKPDQLIKRRGKLGLIKVNVNSQEAKKWIDERMGKDIQVCD